MLKKNTKTLRYILPAIVMPFLRANVINPRKCNAPCNALFVLNFIFEPSFVHVPDIVHFLKFLFYVPSLIKFVDIL